MSWPPYAPAHGPKPGRTDAEATSNTTTLAARRPVDPCGRTGAGMQRDPSRRAPGLKPRQGRGSRGTGPVVLDQCREGGGRCRLGPRGLPAMRAPTGTIRVGRRHPAGRQLRRQVKLLGNLMRRQQIVAATGDGIAGGSQPREQPCAHQPRHRQGRYSGCSTRASGKHETDDLEVADTRWTSAFNSIDRSPRNSRARPGHTAECEGIARSSAPRQPSW